MVIKSLEPKNCMSRLITIIAMEVFIRMTAAAETNVCMNATSSAGPKFVPRSYSLKTATGLFHRGSW
jgi:hypothetical protein